jgi:hypothetical protein
MNPIVTKQPDGSYKIGNYYAYPIYSFSMNWEQKGPQDEIVKNGTHFSRMFKTEQSNEVLQNIIDNHEKEFKSKYTIVGDIQSSFKLHVYETWCLIWFSHYTYDIGQTDEEAKDSFEQYVQRHEDYQHDLNYRKIEGRVCLMGANDRYRWCSKDSNDEPNYDQVPCRCNKCKEAGVLFIDH